MSVVDCLLLISIDAAKRWDEYIYTPFKEEHGDYLFVYFGEAVRFLI
jgi:hypothetical protein